jgi:hypothetical protein
VEVSVRSQGARQLALPRTLAIEAQQVSETGKSLSDSFLKSLYNWADAVISHQIAQTMHCGG